MSIDRVLHAGAMLMASILVCACGSSGSSSPVLHGNVSTEIDKASTVAFSADGKTVAVTGYDKKIVFVDVASATVRSSIENTHHRRVLHSAFVSNLHTASWDGIKVWQPGSGEPIYSIDAGGKLIETEFYGVVATSKGTKTGTFTGERFDGGIDSMVVTPDELYALVVAKQSGEKSLTVYDLELGGSAGSLQDAENALFSPDGQVVAVRDREKGERIELARSVKFKYYNTTTLYSVPDLWQQEELSGLWAHAFSADGNSLLGRTDDEELVLMSIDGTLLATLSFEGRVRFARFSPDGRFVLVSSGSSISCFDTSSGEQRWRSGMDADEAGQVVQITPNSRFAIYCGDGPGSPVQIVELETGKVCGTVKGKSIPTGFALSPDGRTLAIPMYKNGLALWTIGS